MFFIKKKHGKGGLLIRGGVRCVKLCRTPDLRGNGVSPPTADGFEASAPEHLQASSGTEELLPADRRCACGHPEMSQGESRVEQVQE